MSIWTPAIEADLARLHAEGMQLPAIARELMALHRIPVTRDAVAAHVRKMGLPPRARRRHDWTPEQIATLRRMRTAGDNLQRIAKRMGLGSSVVEHGAIKYCRDIKPPPLQPPPAPPPPDLSVPPLPMPTLDPGPLLPIYRTERQMITAWIDRHTTPLHRTGYQP